MMLEFQIKMLLVPIISLILGITQVLSEIEVNCGQLVLQGYTSCEIKHNNNVTNYNGPLEKILPGLYFGLIEFECDHLAGHVMSNIDCDNCNFECSEDAAASSECQTDSSHIWLGGILGIIFSILVGGLLYTRMYAEICTYFKGTKHSNKVCEDDSKTTIGMGDTDFLKEKVESNEIKDGERDSPAATDKDNKKRTVSRKSKVTKKRTLVSTIAGLLLFRASEACNIIIGVESNNVTMICKGSDCKTEAAPFNVQQGDKVCIEDHSGGVVSLQISEIIWRLRYELVYYTSDFKFSVTTKTDTFCRNIHYWYCYDNKNCSEQAIAKLTTLPGPQENVHTTCASSSSLADCTCCAYLIKKERQGELYGILRKIGEQGIIKFKIKGEKYSKEVVLSNLDPYLQLHLKNFEFKNADLISIAVLNTFKETSPSNSLLRYDDKLYYVSGSDVKSPKNGSFGDCQVSLDKFSVDFVKPLFDGSARDGCSSKQMQNPESMISKFVNQKNDYKQPNNYIVRKADYSTIDTFETYEKGRVALHIGGWGFKSVDQMEGKCNVELLGSYGCSYCNESAYVVFGARDIEKEGLIPFYSNCTFNRQSIKCDYEPTKLILKNNNSTCFIRMPTLNKQFLVDVNYFNYGHRIKLRGETNCLNVHYSFGEALTHLVTSKKFFCSFLGTVLIFIVLGAFLKCVPIVHKSKLQNAVEKDSVEL